MSDIDGAAAPAEGISAPVAEAAPTPNPIATEAEGHAPEPEEKGKPEPKPVNTEPEVKKPLTTREALQKAAEKVEKDNAPDKTKEVKTEAKPDDKAKPADTKPAEVKRDETGKFAPKSEASPEVAKETPPVGKEDVEAKPSEGRKPHHEPPAGFLQHAKEDWAKIPETVQEELHRRVANIEQGIQKHRQRAEAAEGAYEPYRELDEIAKQNGKHGAEVFREYFAMENHLRKDLVGGLNEICQRVGVSLKDVAAHVMGQTPDQNASAQDATIRELRAELAEIKNQVGSVTQTFQKQQETATQSEVEKFAAAPGHERFNEIADDIAFFLKTRTNDLSEAYKLAERLNPAPAQAPTPPRASPAPVIDLQAQTQKGQKSIAGSPTPGSDPAARQPSKSIKESIRRAVAQAG